MSYRPARARVYKPFKELRNRFQPGEIDSKESILLAESVAWNRFMGPLKSLKLPAQEKGKRNKKGEMGGGGNRDTNTQFHNLILLLWRGEGGGGVICELIAA